MKISIEEKDETQTYRPVSVDQFVGMVKCLNDRVEIYVPNLCGGETKITIFRSTCNEGNIDNLIRKRLNI